MAYTIRPRYGTTAGYAALNRVYAAGELLCELGVDGLVRMKVADGVTAYNSLDYVVSGEGAGSVPAFGTISVPGQSDVVAEAQGDTVTLIGSSGIALTTNAATDTLTLAPQYGTAANTICQGNDTRLSGGGQPAAHAVTHRSGGTDAIKLDQLAAPDDVTTLNASTAAHGLLPKLDGNNLKFLNGVGSWVVPPMFGSIVSVKDYGAVGNGSADDTAAIAQAISTGAGAIYFPDGTYRITSPIVTGSNKVLFGSSRAAATISYAMTGNSAFYVSGNQHVTITRLSFVGPTSGTVSGASIDIENSHNIRISDVTIYYGHNGIQITGGNISYIHYFDSLEISDCAQYGILLGTSTALVQGVWVSDAEIASCNVGIAMFNISGVTLCNIDVISSATHAFIIAPSNGQRVTAAFMNQCFADTSAQNGYAYVTSGTGYYNEVNMTGCWAAANSGYGLLCSGDGSGITISANRIIGNGQHGVYIYAANNVSLSSSQMLCNNASDGNFNGVLIDGAASAISVTGCTSGYGGIFARLTGVNRQRHGIQIGASVEKYIIANNICSQNTVSPISDLSASASKSVTGNIS